MTILTISVWVVFCGAALGIVAVLERINQRKQDRIRAELADIERRRAENREKFEWAMAAMAQGLDLKTCGNFSPEEIQAAVDEKIRRR